MTRLESITARISRIEPVVRHGQVSALAAGTVEVAGLSRQARIGTLIGHGDQGAILGEVIAITASRAVLMPYEDLSGLRIGTPVHILPPLSIAASAAWAGRIVDPLGRPMDGGGALPAGSSARGDAARPPAPVRRRGIGQRMRTGVAAIDTMLPLARGQRIGVFAGSGVGKTSLLSEIAREAQADLIVFALIGERGRELMQFARTALGPEGMARSVLVCATSDQSPLLKRRAAFTAMSVAETLRDQGAHVLLIVDSLTRLAEAHREVALTAGEPPTLGGHPPTLGALVAGFAERAGPGEGAQGDITGVFSVLVAGSDMDEPVADIARGILDGHIVLDRDIAERGRFPAIDVRRSVSRSLPDVATTEENALIQDARRVLGTYEAAEPMIQAGLYIDGSDARIDRAKAVWPALDRFFEITGAESPEAAFATLAETLSGAGSE